jgi:hypothetical protein
MVPVLCGGGALHAPQLCCAGALLSFHFAEFFGIPIFILCAPSARSVFRK